MSLSQQDLFLHGKTENFRKNKNKTPKIIEKVVDEEDVRIFLFVFY